MCGEIGLVNTITAVPPAVEYRADGVHLSTPPAECCWQKREPAQEQGEEVGSNSNWEGGDLHLLCSSSVNYNMSP